MKKVQFLVAILLVGLSGFAQETIKLKIKDLYSDFLIFGILKEIWILNFLQIL